MLATNSIYRRFSSPSSGILYTKQPIDDNRWVVSFIDDKTTLHTYRQLWPNVAILTAHVGKVLASKNPAVKRGSVYFVLYFPFPSGFIGYPASPSSLMSRCTVRIFTPREAANLPKSTPPSATRYNSKTRCNLIINRPFFPCLNFIF